MDTSELIHLLNLDLAEEHAATLRYLVHSYMEGEDTPLGASLLSRSREEMWHMHWLGMVIGHLGGEPDLRASEYPYDPTNRATILDSYIKYEEQLVPHYQAEAEKVDDPHIKRVLEREAWESSIHARMFRRKLGKLSNEEAEGLPQEEQEMATSLLDWLQSEVNSKYNEMLQHIRQAWVFQKNGLLSWEIMNQSMEKMKQLAHFAEDVAENGLSPDFGLSEIERSSDLKSALKGSLDSVDSAQERHIKGLEDQETKKHAGLMVNLDMTIRQETYQSQELKSWLESL
ncbi:MAG TPA: ferritin-like domain-containing protein [Desulfohalobiaceae bacterium]|nr:ferritin-like domain-containing protein [Desulfohalobiaceae bacterium]